MDLHRAHDWIDREFRRIGKSQSVPGLYAPIGYLLERDRSRYHAMLALASYAPGGKPLQQAVPMAAGMEVFHEFLLMTEDLLRDRTRFDGQPAVHRRWDQNAVILSGDVMLIYAYQLLVRSGITDVESLSRYTAACRVALEGCYLLDVERVSPSFTASTAWLDQVADKRAEFTRVCMELAAQRGGISADSVEALGKLGHQLGKALFYQNLAFPPCLAGLPSEEVAALAQRHKQLTLEGLAAMPFDKAAAPYISRYIPQLFA